MPRTLSKAEVSAFRNKLCQTAEELFITYGVKGFTMRRLASAVGVSAMTPYRYYHNKSALLAAVRANAFNALAETLKQAYLSGGEPEDALHRQCRAYSDFASSHWDQYQLMFSCPADEPSAQPLEESYQVCLHWLSAGVSDIINDSNAGISLEKIVFTLWSAMHGVVTTSRINHITDPGKIADIVMQTIFYLLAGSRLTDLPSDTRHPSMTKISSDI